MVTAEIIQTALSEAYSAFYDMPRKTLDMFDAMDDTAKVLRAKPDYEQGMARARVFYDTFAAVAKTEAQKRAIDQLLVLTI